MKNRYLVTEIESISVIPQEIGLPGAWSKRMVKNLFWLTNSTVLSVLLNMAVNFFLARALGAAGYGQFAVILASCSWILVLRTAVGSDLIRKSAHDSRFARQAFAPAILGLSISASLVGLAAVGVNFALIHSTLVLLPSILISLSFVVSTYSGVPVSLFTGRDRMHWQLMESVISLFILLGLIILARRGLSLLKVSSIYLFSYTCICLTLVARGAWLIRPRLWAGDKLFRKSLVTDAINLLSVNVLLTVHWSLELYFLQLWQSSTAVGIYNAAYKLAIVFRLAPSIIMMSLIPEAARRAACNDLEFIRRIWVKTARLFIVVGCGLAIFVLPLSSFIIRATYSSGFENSSRVLMVLIIALLPLFVQSVTQSLLYAAGHYRDLTMGYGIGLASQAVLDLMLIPRFGVQGAAVAFLISECIILICLVFFGLRRFGLPPLRGVFRAQLGHGSRYKRDLLRS